MIRISSASVASSAVSGFHGVYHLNESASGALDEIQDSSFPAHHGRGASASQSPTSTSGQIGGAQLFNGSDDHILVDPSDSFNFTTNEFTLEYWASWPNTGSLMNTVSKGGNPGGFRCGIDERGLAGCYLRGHLMHAPIAPSNDSFHYLVTSWDGNTIRIYVDGVLAIEEVLDGNYIGSNDPLYVGRQSGGSFFTGIIDEVRIRDSALSGPWIEAQYRSMQDNYITYEEGI